MKNFLNKLKIKIILLFLILGNISFAQSRIQKIDKLLDSLFLQQKFNGNILIAERGEVIYKRSYGFANEITKEKLTQKSIFELASCSKQFTAMGIVILKEKGKLNFDDKISKYIPELSDYKEISIKNLLHHTGGLPDYMQLMDTIWDKTKIASNKDIIEFFSKYKPKVLFEPNTKHEYSNTGYALLATIIEKVSGQTYAEFLKEQIFKPLKMKNSFVYNRRLSPKKIKNYAIGYLFIKSQNKYVLPDDYEKTKMVYWLDGVVGDGTVNSNVIDLLKWDRSLYTTKLVSGESLKEVFANGLLNDGSSGKHGFGWRMLDTKEFGRIAKHSGGWPGYMTYIERNTDNDKTIIILQNHYNVTMPADEIRNILYNIEKK
jgi:CubicO group peptidase (beta-lactamase class C family)